MSDAVKHKATEHQLYFIGSLLQEKVNNGLFVKLDGRYKYYFPEETNYFGRALRILKSMYGMTNYGKLFSGGLTEWLLEACFIQYKCRMYIYYKYALYGKEMFYLMFMTVYIGILLNFSGNGLWML